MIRVATHDDIPRLIDLGKMLHDQSSFAALDFDRIKVRASLLAIIDGAGVVFVAERDGEIVGGFAGGVASHWFGNDMFGFDYSFFIEPTRRHGITAIKLLTAFREWAKLRGAREIRLGISTGIMIEQTGALYEAFGMTLTGPLYRMEL